MELSEFDYNLPGELIAQSPIEPRDASRLLVLGQEIEHRFFYELPDYLERGDTLVLNDSRVIPTKLIGRKNTGGRVEALVISCNDGGYECLLRGKNIHVGTQLYFGSLEAKVLEVLNGPINTRYLVGFNCNGNLVEILEKTGEAPLPPYIKKKLVDKDRYQTVYSRMRGSIAAPTAGLHFTHELLEKIKEKGIRIAYVTLHVSLGTFTPVKTKNVESHIMEPEYFAIRREDAETINGTRGKIVAAGTTTVKALESSCIDGRIIEKEGMSDLFIYPSYRFKSRIDALVTNFHLPKSTLLMLVSAFAGKERIKAAYYEAIARAYRFYSFGDSMLVFKEG